MFARTIDLPAAKQISFTNLEKFSGLRLFSAARTKESLEISHFGRIFPASGRPGKVTLKIARFSRILRAVAGISVLSLEIRIFSRKFQKVAGNPRKSQDFPTRSRSFKFSAELLNSQRKIRKFGRSLDFPADHFVFP